MTQRVDPNVPVWTGTGPQPARWWVRRLLHESVVHRVDAALALGVDHPIEPPLAADGQWTIRGSTAGIRWEHSHGAGSDVAVRGAAADLFLALVRRGDDGRLVVAGEREHWTTWLANSNF